MKTVSSLHAYFRILVVSIFVALLGLGSTPHALSGLLSDAYQSAAVGDYHNAAKYLIDISAYYPERADIIIQAAHFAFQAGESQLVIQYLGRPDVNKYLLIDDRILLGDAYLQNGEIVKAEAVWADVAQQSDSQQVIQRLADLYLQQKDYSSAVTYLRKLIDLDPTNGQLYYRVGCLEAFIDPLKALPYLAQAAQIDPSIAANAQALHNKIRTANLFEQPAYTLLVSGRQLASVDEWVYATEAFKRATEQDPDYADAWAFLGEAEQQVIIQETGSTTDAGLDELQHAIHLDADSILANTFFGLYWERQQDFSQAQHYLEKAIDLDPSDPYLYSELGNILSKSGELPAAQTEYEKAIQLTPQNPLFYRLLAGFALENHIQVRELALPAARQAVILDENDSDSLDMMAQVMLALEDYHSAENYSLEAVHANPANVVACLHLGTVYLNLGEPTLAYQWLSTARDLDPGSWASAQADRMISYYFP